MPVADTSFLVDVLRGNPEAARLLEILQQEPAPLATTPLTHFELHRGVAAFRRPADERQRVESLLRELTVFPLDVEAARLAGTIDGKLRRAGKESAVMDLLIASVALHKGEAVVTRNAKDFRKVPGLNVLSY